VTAGNDRIIGKGKYSKQTGIIIMKMTLLKDALATLVPSYSFNFTQSDSFHATSEFVHVELGTVAGLFIVTSRFINISLWIPRDIRTSPTTVQIDVVEESPPERIKGQDLWVSDND
jgi:hypothetical protein